MAGRKQVGDIVRSRDRYKQTRVVREDEVAKKHVEWKPKAKPDLNKGDICTTTLHPLFYTIKEPIVVMDIQPDRRYVFDWGVQVQTSIGPRWFGASLFMKIKPEH